jgi:hypothetical protein
VNADDPSGALDFQLRINAAGKPEFRTAAGTVTGPTTLTLNQWTLIGFTINTIASLAELWVNGVSVASSAAFTSIHTSVEFRVGRLVVGTNYFGGYIGHILQLDDGLASVDMLRLYTAGQAGLGETVDTRIARWLRYCLLQAADYNLDASTVTLATYDQANQDTVRRRPGD